MGSLAHSTLERNSPEWNAAWSTFDDPIQENEGETWEYMGTEHHQETGWVHVFRHRCHPMTSDRHYRSVPASPEWTRTLG